MSRADRLPAEPVARFGQIPVTVVVPVKNEEANLPRCLPRLGRFAEVVVVDSGSTDRTPEIARDLGATLLHFTWNGRYPKKRNWVLLNHPIRTEWVLFLDADELVDDRFCDEVAAAVAAGRHAGYWLSYTNHFLGRRLRHGVPQRKLALFRVGSGLYERIEEQSWSGLDMEIHEHPVLDGSIGSISAPIEHNDFRGIGKFVERHRDYAAWEARRLLLLRRCQTDAAAALTPRQRFKYANLDRWWYPWFYFVYTYVVRAGFLDGSRGFYYALYKTWYFLTIKLMLDELRAGGQEKGPPSAPGAAP